MCGEEMINITESHRLGMTLETSLSIIPLKADIPIYPVFSVSLNKTRVLNPGDEIRFPPFPKIGLFSFGITVQSRPMFV